MRIFLIATLLIALQTLLIGAHAQTYPAKSVRIIASVLPGDTCDILVRMLGYKMGDRLGQQFVIDNRAGASGQLGHAMVAQAGFTYAHIPFKGCPQMAGDIISGRLDASFGSFPTVLPYVQTGRMRSEHARYGRIAKEIDLKAQ